MSVRTARPRVVLAVVGLCLALGAVAYASKGGDSLIGQPGPVTGAAADGGLFNDPRDVAVLQSTGQIFVADAGLQRVQRLSSSGAFEVAWGRNVSESATVGDDSGAGGFAFEICTVAADCQGGGSAAAVGGFAGGRGGMFDDPQGVAVDQDTGHVFVVDRDNRRVQEFAFGDNGTPANPADDVPQFVRAFGADVDTAGGTDFEICTTASICKSGVAGSGAGQLGPVASSVGIDVTKDGAAGSGQLFVGDPGNARVMEFELDGDFVRAWGVGVDSGSGTAFEICTTASGCQGGSTQVDGTEACGERNGGFGTGVATTPQHVAVGADGVVYAETGRAGDAVKVLRFDSTVAGDDDAAAAALLVPDPLCARGESQILQSGLASGMEVDPETGNLLFVIDRAPGASDDTVVQEIDAGADPPLLVDTHMRGAGSQEVNGLGVDRAGSSDRLLVTSNEGLIGHRLLVLDEDGAAPPPTANASVADVAAHDATLSGTVNPNGLVFAVTARYEYSKNGTDWTQAGAPIDVGTGNSPVALPQRSVTGLEANTEYHYRVVASRAFNAGTTISAGPATFTTDRIPPTVEPLSAARVSDTSAQLQARLNPEGLPTSWRFEYLTEARFAQDGWAAAERAPVPDAEATGGQARVVAVDVEDLEPATDYRFRLVASNGEEVAPGDTTVEGDTRTFTTRSAAVPPDGRAYEMVTSPDKVNRRGEDCEARPVLAIPGACPATAIVSTDGESILWSAGQGTIIDPDSGNESSGQRNWELIRRGAERWKGEAVFNQAYLEASVDAATVLDGLSADLETQAWRLEAGMFPSLGSHGTKVFGDTGGLDGSGWYDWLSQPWLPNPADEQAFQNGSDMAIVGDDRSFMVRFDDQTSAYRGLLGNDDPSAAGYPHEQQVVTVDATGGTFRLTFNGQTTGSIQEAAPATGSGSVYNALVALAAVGPNDVAVEGSPGGPWTVTFLGALDRTNHPLMTGNGASLTGGAATVAVSPLRDGVVAPASTLTQTDGRAPYRSGPPSWTPQELISECTAGTEIPARVDSGTPWGAGGVGVADDTLGAVACDSGSVVSARGAYPGGSEGGSPAINANAVSTDGRRMFMIAPDPETQPVGLDGTAPGGCVDAQPGDVAGAYGSGSDCTPQLYVRQYDVAGDPTLRWISRPEVPGQNPDGLFDAAIFENASTDGRHVFFRTRAPLTADDPNGACGAPCTTGTASGNSWDLYRYTLPASLDDDPTGAQAGGLKRITGGPSGADDPNTNSSGPSQPGSGSALRHVSDDGSKAYFVTRAPLDDGPDDDLGTGDDPWNAPPKGVVDLPGGSATQNDTRNLYLYDGEADSYRFVARIPYGTPTDANNPDPDMCASASRAPAWSRSIDGIVTNRSCVRGSSSGDALLFETAGRLTGDDADDATDLYLYDADADELIRISAPPAGSEPYICDMLIQGGGISAVPNPDRRCNADTGFTPTEYGQHIGGTSGLRHLNIAEDGDGKLRAVYFQSRIRFTPDDVNGDHFDTYEWRAGRVTLMSPGTSDDHAFFAGSSRDGQDVFFHTTERISPWEIDVADGDVYVARVGGGMPDPPDPHEVCDVHENACQPPGRGPGAAPPIDSERETDGNADGKRTTLSVRAPGAKARRAAARSGVLRLRVASNARGTVAATARARVGKGRGRLRAVGRARTRLSKPGAVVLRIRLSRAARTELRTARRLRLRIRVTQADAAPRATTVTLRRPGR